MLLFGSSCPPNISRKITYIIIDTIDRVSFTGMRTKIFDHVGMERLEITPRFIHPETVPT